MYIRVVRGVYTYGLLTPYNTTLRFVSIFEYYRECVIVRLTREL